MEIESLVRHAANDFGDLLLEQDADGAARVIRDKLRQRRALTEA